MVPPRRSSEPCNRPLTLDFGYCQVHTRSMGWTSPQVEIEDLRDGDRRLRVAWHASKRTVVVSQWRGGICVASTPFDIGEVPDLIDLLVRALGEAAAWPAQDIDHPPTARTVGRDISKVVRSRLRPRLAPILALSGRRHGRGPRG